MKRFWAFVPVVLAILALAGLASADEIKGVINKVDADKKELVVEGRHGSRGLMLAFTVAKDTKITVGHQAGAMADLQSGEKVRVFYETRDGKRVALTVAAHGSKRPAAASPSSTSPAGDNSVAGVLRRVARTDREIVVIGPGAQGAETETTLQVPEDVRITKDQKALKLDDLKEGEKVAVRTEKRNGKLTAVAIAVGEGAAPAAPERKGSKVERVLKLLDKGKDKPEKPEKKGDDKP
jgi:Cu/Ag efflux protein CusF